MKRQRGIVLAIALFGLLASMITSCGVTQGTQPPPPQKAPTQPPPVAGNFGSVTISPQYVALSPGQTQQFTASSSSGGALTWLVNGVAGGSAAFGTVDSTGKYIAPASLPQSVNVSITAELASSPQQNQATAVASIINEGVIFPTKNPQVVEYTVYLPAPGKVSVEFGTTTSYGRNTWQVSTPTAYGGQINLLVAGMLAQTTYHMRAQIVLSDGATFTDIDHDQFSSGLPLTTGSPPPTSATTISSPGTPQPGIELWNTIIPQAQTQLFATDLQGNVLWTYTYQGTPLDTIQGAQLLPDGDVLMVISFLSSLTQGAGFINPGTINSVREVDLAGNTVRELTMDQLNQRLATAGFHDSDGSAYQLKSFHHNVLALPNGHWVVLTAYPKNINLPGSSGTTSVLGDVLVDVDQNGNPDWVWSSFDHLDLNRRPMNFPDWTHSNDMLYSSDDHNLLLSIRHQNWIIKIDFGDGHGSGNILWHLGEGGDFQLLNSAGQPDTNPADWFYAQHGMNYFTPNTTGVFRIGLMDNGNDRIFPGGQQMQCKPFGAGSSQCYSTVPVLELNESNMTATLIHHYMPGPTFFSFFGGDVQQLANGDIHIDFCSPAGGSIVQELDSAASQLKWRGSTANEDQFKVDRLPSLYPGVQW